MSVLVGRKAPEFTAQAVQGDNIIEEFERNARIDTNNIQVEVDGSKAISKEEVRNLDEYPEAKDDAWDIPGVTEVMADDLDIS